MEEMGEEPVSGRMKKIIAINGSPRSGWNTDILVRDAAAGAEANGAEVEVIDLYRREKFSGCVSCFGCKTEGHMGQCVCRDGLYEVLEKIRHADGLILGSPVYLGDISAGMRALYERLVFQYITYKTEVRSYNARRIPVVLIVTSNVPAEYDAELLGRYKGTLEAFVGPTHTLASGNTLQVMDYERYGWTMFNAGEKKVRRETVFPEEKKNAYRLGADMLGMVL